MDAGFPFQTTTGASSSVLAFPVDPSGRPLAGAFACTFMSSDSSLLGLTARTPIRADLLPLAPGTATVTATCGSMSTFATFVIDGAYYAIDASSDGASDADDGAADASADGASDAPDGVDP